MYLGGAQLPVIKSLDRQDSIGRVLPVYCTCAARAGGLSAVWTVYCCLGQCSAGILVLPELGIRPQYDRYITVGGGGFVRYTFFGHL